MNELSLPFPETGAATHPPPRAKPTSIHTTHCRGETNKAILPRAEPPGAAKMKAQSQPLQVLMVEDEGHDAALLEIELERAGYAPACHRVETAADMEAALQHQMWDVVIADAKLPRFSGLAALALVKSKGLDLPFILVSGRISEETAVDAMKAGAHDYVMKNNLARLGQAVQRELREAEMRRERRRTEEKLKVERALREAIENSVPSGIAAVDLEGRQTYVNPAFCALLGWSETELVGAKPPFVYWPPDEVESIREALSRVVQGSAPANGIELRFRRRTGERIYVLVQITPLKDSFGNITGWVSSISDITERKRAEARLAAEHAITRILANAQSLEEAAPGILQVLLDSLEVDLGQLWTVMPKGSSLKLCSTTLRASSPPFQSFIEHSRGLCLSSGVALPGRVWQERRALWVTDLSQQADFERQALAATAGLHSALAFPIQSPGDFFGVLEFFSIRRLEEDPTLLNMMSAVGGEIGQFVQRRRAEDALRRAHDELEMRVQQRTAELKTANAKLQASISERERLEHELLEITEKERRRIGLDLHDDLGQKLSGIAMMTKGLELKLAKQRADTAQDAARIHSLVQQAMNHASDLAHDLATLDLKENDLPSALEDLAAHASELFEISCQFRTKGTIPPLNPTVVSQFYKIAQEAVTNAIKHGKAKQVDIGLANGAGKVVLTIKNNGLPFPDLKGHHQGMGLRIMNYRASLTGASLEIKGTGARGTLVTCCVPLESCSR